MRKIKEPALIIIDMLFTPDMYPLPDSAVIVKNHGPGVVTDKGSVKHVGARMEVEFDPDAFIEWTQPRIGKSMWLWNKDNNNFDEISLQMEEDKPITDKSLN